MRIQEQTRERKTRSGGQTNTFALLLTTAYPALDELRSNPRYHALVEKIGFPPVPSSSGP